MSIKKAATKRGGREALRTTVTLDGDVRRRATEFSRARGISFREGLNELVRIGLVAQQRPAVEKPYEFKTYRMGLKPGLSYDKIEDLIEFGEGPHHR
ncbi:MAG: hypothetical protein ABI995_05090 [Acidobacteriota bacterium]